MEGNLDPGVNSEDEEDEVFGNDDSVSYKSSASSLRSSSTNQEPRSREGSMRSFTRSSSGRSKATKSESIVRQRGMPKSATMGALATTTKQQSNQEEPLTPGTEEFTAKLFGTKGKLGHNLTKLLSWSKCQAHYLKNHNSQITNWILTCLVSEIFL